MQPVKNFNPISKSSDIRNNHLLDLKNQFANYSKKLEPFNSLVQIKPRINVIKINKNKLPADFFPKCWSFQKKTPHFKLSINHHQRQIPSLNRIRGVQSQRLHNSPENVSFFGFFEQQQFGPKHLEPKRRTQKRKFQTREVPKRENSDMKRRFTPGSNYHRNDLLDLFPATYDQQITQIITSNSSVLINKISPRKQHSNKHQELVYDPEKDELGMYSPSSAKYDKLQNHSKAINLKTIQNKQDQKGKGETTFINSQTVDLHNLTFFNAKSSCLPPIKKV